MKDVLLKGGPAHGHELRTSSAYLKLPMGTPGGLRFIIYEDSGWSGPDGRPVFRWVPGGSNNLRKQVGEP
jgi:hypothetical protein